MKQDKKQKLIIFMWVLVMQAAITLWKTVNDIGDRGLMFQ